MVYMERGYECARSAVNTESRYCMYASTDSFLTPFARSSQALKWHPDKNRDNPKKAEERFKVISEAYEVRAGNSLKPFFALPPPALSETNVCALVQECLWTRKQTLCCIQ